MTDDTTEMSGTVEPITVEHRYHTRGGGTSETYELSHHEAQELLELALRDSLDGVDARVIQNEVEARSE